MIEDKLKKTIIEKFGSVRNFALKINIPYTTVDSILKRGIDNSNVGNVLKMCKALKISLDGLLELNDVSNIEAKNEYDEKIKQLETDTGIKISYSSDKPLTQEDYMAINEAVLKEMKEQNKD